MLQSPQDQDDMFGGKGGNIYSIRGASAVRQAAGRHQDLANAKPCTWNVQSQKASLSTLCSVEFRE